MFNVILKADEIKSGKSNISIRKFEDKNFGGSDENLSPDRDLNYSGRLEDENFEISDDPVVNATAKAKRIIQNAKKEAEKIEREAYQKGFEAGEKTGIEVAEKKIESVLRDFQSIINTLISTKEEITKKFENDLIKLSLLIAEKILHQQIKLDNKIVLKVAQEILAKAIKSEKITLKVSNFDLDFILKNKTALNQISDPAPLLIEGDPNISRGGCVVFTDSGEIDAQIETQIKRIRNLLMMDNGIGKDEF